VRIARRVSPRDRASDLRCLVRQLPMQRTDRLRVIRGYVGTSPPDDPVIFRVARPALARAVIHSRTR
jgi:hypothetical protein